MNHDVQAVTAELVRLLLEDLKIAVDADKLAPHVPLLDEGLGLDSITLFELIALIEKRYEITFRVETLNSEVFADLSAVARQICSMLDANRAGEAREASS